MAKKKYRHILKMAKMDGQNIFNDLLDGQIYGYKNDMNDIMQFL